MWSDLQLLLGFNAGLILLGGIIKGALLDPGDGPRLSFLQDVHQVRGQGSRPRNEGLGLVQRALQAPGGSPYPR